MSSILNAGQRAFIAVDTKIDRLIIDRTVEAYDALLAGNVEEYKMKLATAIVQMGYGRDVQPSDRPTAVDVIRTIVQHAVADRWLTTFPVATTRMQRMLDES